MKFIQFGCWNEFTCNKSTPKSNPVSAVMSKLDKVAGDVDFIIVSGDNYYPPKEVTKFKKGSTYNGVVLESDLKIKRKKIYTNDIIAGFECLPKNVEVNVILGNHDLESQKKDVLYLENGELEQPGACTILNTERGASSANPNFNFGLYISKYDEISKTMVLMLDTSMYSVDDVDEMVTCYQHLIERKPDQSDADYIEHIRTSQFEVIAADIAKYKEAGGIANLIISGHHPISGYKLKLSEDKQKFVVLGDDLGPFIETLSKIYTIAGGNDVNYYYLCADLHLYQQGTVKIQVDDVNEMVIKQYIVGTGGTELDPNPFSVKPVSVIDKPIIGDKHRYIMSEEDVKVSTENYGHGFLLCEMKDMVPEFAFNLVLQTGGGRRKRTTSKRKRTTRRKRTASRRNRSTRKSTS